MCWFLNTWGKFILRIGGVNDWMWLNKHNNVLDSNLLCLIFTIFCWNGLVMYVCLLHIITLYPILLTYLLSLCWQDPGGYGLLYVDASQRANVGSSCSHSCNSNCTSAVVGMWVCQLFIIPITLHSIYQGVLTLSSYPTPHFYWWI